MIGVDKVRAGALAGYFKRKYGPLAGRDWLNSLPVDERKAFAELGRELADNGRAGGLARAATAARDQRGRFAKNGS